MSTIYFHTPSGEAKVRGSERAYMASVCSDLAIGLIGVPRYAKSWIEPYIQGPTSGLFGDDGREARLPIWFSGYNDAAFLVDGMKADAFSVGLNTALLLGNDNIRLMARLHGQCEIHCWIAGYNRKWVSEIIKKGRINKILRSNQGWESVIDLLIQNESEPVVCSYSVCDSFPNFSCLPVGHLLRLREDDERFEDFYDIPTDELWDLCFSGLKAKGEGLEITPNNWEEFRFSPGISILDMMNKESEVVS